MFSAIGAILCLAYILFVHNLGGISLWDPDEPRQAIQAREMMERSDYIHPYLNGQPYLEKPPLYPWLIVMASKAQGSLNEFSARIPSALAATVLLIITFLAARRMTGDLAGLLSALILATNFQFLGNARESVMDMTFALFIGLTIYLGDLAIKSNRRWLFACALLPSVLSVLSKGPAGLIITVGVFFLLLVSQNKVKTFLLPLLVGCVLSLGLSSIWFGVAGKAYASEFILHQNMTRYVKGFDHIESAFYYLPKLFFNFLPWSCLLPFAIYHAYKRRLWLPLIWFAFTFVFFELSRSKRGIYLLPLYPAMALLVGIFLREKWQSIVENKWSNLGLKAFAVLITVSPLLVAVAPWAVIKNQRDMLLGAGLYGWFPLIVLALFGFGFLFFVIRRSSTKSLATLFGFLICLWFFFHSFYMPGMDGNFNSARLITDKLETSIGAQQVYTCGTSSPALIYYLGRPIPYMSHPDQIPRDRAGVMVVAEAGHGCPERLANRFSTIAQIPYRRDQYVIMMSR